jgi:hypothetical protein
MARSGYGTRTNRKHRIGHSAGPATHQYALWRQRATVRTWLATQRIVLLSEMSAPGSSTILQIPPSESTTTMIASPRRRASRRSTPSCLGSAP